MGKLRGQLQRWCKQHGMKVPEEKSEEKKKIKSENLSKFDIEELMGTRKRVHRRGRGGALKQ